nr:primosomal protein N' [Desulfobulbaceae bacterium]
MYLEVAVASPISNTLTYKSSPDFPASVYRPGLRVLVPLGPRLVTGYILRCAHHLDADPQYAIRAINDLLDPEPIFPENMVAFFEWLAGYYHYPIGEVIKSALPGGLTPQSERRVTLTSTGQSYFSGQSPAEHPAQPWFNKLLADQRLSLTTTKQIWRSKERRLLKKLENAGHVIIENVVSTDSIKTKTETCYAVANSDYPT